MAPFAGKGNVSKALYNLQRELVENDQLRDDEKSLKRTWIQYYKNKLKEYESKQKRIKRR